MNLHRLFYGKFTRISLSSVCMFTTNVPLMNIIDQDKLCEVNNVFVEISHWEGCLQILPVRKMAVHILYKYKLKHEC